ncbi:MAG: TIGR00282 family metallophosphoesterase, partial [Opitutales bacterium]
MKILFLGDVVGRPGRRALAELIPAYREAQGLDLVIVNAENAAGGSGLTAKISEEIRSCGVDAMTLGDHVWKQRGFDQEIDKLTRVCRPANLPPGNPGREYLILEVEGFRLAVFTVLGRHSMNLKVDCPYRTANRIMSELDGKADGVIAEIHAEATSEKVAMGWHLDGRATAILGSHTHIPTADGRVLPKGSAYLTDLGMSGPYDSVIGRDKEAVLTSFMDSRPRRFAVAGGDVRLCGCLLEVDRETGKALSIES